MSRKTKIEKVDIEDKARGTYIELMRKTGFAAPETMLLSDRAFRNAHDHDEVRGVLRALSVGDIDDFVAKAERLGITKDQAQLAARDTAALGALVMQLGFVAGW